MSAAEPVRTVAAIRAALARAPLLDTPRVRAIRRDWTKALKDETPAHVLDVTRALVASGAWTERVIGFELLAAHPAAFGRLDDALVDTLTVGLADWGSVDLFGVAVAGPAWRQGLVSDAQIMAWAESADRWRRRLALVATVPLNLRSRGGNCDAARTLDICQRLVADRDDMVVKALSWALRELVRCDRAAVEAFLQSNSDRLAARVRREVRNKLETGLKNPR
jgi:hypothetical protein